MPQARPATGWCWTTSEARCVAVVGAGIAGLTCARRLDAAGHHVEVFAEVLARELPEALISVAHRWRYASPEPSLARRCLFDPPLGIGAAGDWCGGPRVEGAFLSGAALAEAVLGGA